MTIRSLSTLWLLIPTFLLASAGQVGAVSASPLVLTHQWPGLDGSAHRYTLSVDEARARRGLLNSKDTLSDSALFTSVLSEARLLAKSLSDEQIELKVEVDGKQYSLMYRAASGKIDEARRRIASLDRFISESYDRLGEVSYYRRDADLGGLKVEHNEVIRDYLDIIEHAHAYFSRRDEGKHIIDQINERLFFLQSIPYDDLKGADFSMMTPLRMLAEGKGDCESKQVFLAGLLKLKFPDKKVALITLPKREHILAAVEVGRRIAPFTYYHDGRHYLILDATGPALAPVQKTNEIQQFWTFATTTQIWREVDLGEGHST